MDGGSGLNLIYQDTVLKMGIDPTKISHSNTTFKGVIPGLEARCTGSLLVEVVSGSPDNFRSEMLTFYIAPSKVAIKHYSEERLSLVLRQYRIMLFSSLRCPVHVAPSQLVEILSVLYARKNVRRLKQPSTRRPHQPE